MLNKEQILKEIESVSREVELLISEYGNFCYDFYTREEIDWGTTEQPMTDEMILADTSMTEEEKEQALYFNSIPKDWESIHKKYCTQIMALKLKLNDLHEQFKLTEHNEEVDRILSSLKKG